MARTKTPISVVVLAKGGEQYVWLFRPGQERDVLRSLGRMAAEPELSLTWYDAVQIFAKVRKEIES